jgi:hypothetical protein
MSLDSLSKWLVSFLKQRGLNPDGRLLFSYDLSQDEYEALRHELSGTISAAGGLESLALHSLGRSRLMAPPAAFVLYASQWWKHEYDGGPWSWAPLLESLGADAAHFSAQLRSEFVARGLSFWQLSPLDKGKAFIGAIVVNGGIPMRLLAHGDGPVALVMSQVLKLASRYHWGSTQVLDAVNERLHLLPSAYRQSQIADLLARFVDAALHLKEEYQLEGVADPVAFLDRTLPDWRRRFPISLEIEAAQTLLTGLVREAAAQGTGSTHGLFMAERRLVEGTDAGCFSLESHLSYPGRIPVESLATLFGLGDEEVPRHFTIDFVADARQPCTDGRLVLGAADPVAVLNVRKWVLRGQSARTEIQLILRSQAGDHGEPCTIEGGSALAEDDPWIFVESEAGYPVLAAAGGARLPHASAWVALAPGWTIEGSEEAEPVGELHSPGMSARQIFCLRSDARLVSAGLAFRVRLGQGSQPGQIYQWKGMRLPEASGRSVFRQTQPPRLFRATEEGLQAVPLSDQQWRRIGSQETLQPREARGPVEVRILDEGEMVARQRIFMLPPEARIEYSSGQAVGVAQVRFRHWGPVELATEVPVNVTTTLSQEGTGIVRIDLSSPGAPPAEFRVHVRWPGMNHELTLTVPYPVSGGRFLRADGSVMQEQETVTLRELIGMRLQIFDTNPDQPKRYEVQLTLGSGKQQVSSRLPVPMLPGVGRAEIRLLDYQQQIESLLGLFDDLNAKVRISLLAGGQSSCEIRVGRYSTTLRSEDGQVRIPEEALGLIPVEELERTKILACPLTQPETTPLALNPVRSEGVHTGSWAAEGMTPELAPWLVYPAPDSAVLFRPLVWVEAISPEAEVSTTDSDQAAEVKSLPDAMSQADPERRWSSMHSALKAMSEDHRHESWPLLDGLWQTFHHLPLTALDVWRMLAKQPKAVLSFLLRSELSDAELAAALRRLHRETGWMPELTTVSDLCEVAQAFWRYWAEEGLAQDRCRKYYKEELEGRLQLLSDEIPSLGPLIETVIFVSTGTVTDLLLEVEGPSRKSTQELFRTLWDGGNSLVNSQLFLVNEWREEWPCRDFVEKEALPAFLQNLQPTSAALIFKLLDRIFWKFDSWKKYYGTQFNIRNQPDFKFSVANLPVLCAFWAATSTSRQWWTDPRSRLALKQIRDFDPIWFEQAYRQAFKVCMSIDGLVQLPAITEQ